MKNPTQQIQILTTLIIVMLRVEATVRRCSSKWVFVFPSPRAGPQFVFDGPGPNLYLAAPALKLYLPALAN